MLSPEFTRSNQGPAPALTPAAQYAPSKKFPAVLELYPADQHMLRWRVLDESPDRLPEQRPQRPPRETLPVGVEQDNKGPFMGKSREQVGWYDP